MSWVILGHAVGFELQRFQDVTKMSLFFPKMIGRFQAIANAYVSVGTFFALSGLLVSYLGLKELKKNNGKLNWGILTPPYMLILGVYVSLNRYWGGGPLWPENGIENDFCKDTWWKNLLNINNIVDRDNQFFGWAWYLANDMQFYILSPLMFVPLYFFNGWGLISSAVFLIGNGVATYFVSVKYKLPPSTLGVVDEKTTFDYTINYYFVPWCRIGPYVIGVVAGYCLYNTNGRKKIHWALNLLGWAVATALSVTVLYGLHDAINGNPLSIEVAALYNATHRTVLGACVCWVVVAGYINTLLSWEGFSPLSRLTYCAYLVHPILMYIYFESHRQPIYFTDMELIVRFLSFLMASMAVAFVASLTFESPMMD
ncbi:hypothetical protein KUTeg_022556 [Tegillarca granosa]|uniref:Acyltransferase 3 domain-containing protein n=1 Tax=Tegillarca granosa TaxID=220873 RepID=A0ABQ9EAX4_TEGGR|nr:hypothetical protein KUTeg_022556 [Tegillarca granosa]